MSEELVICGVDTPEAEDFTAESRHRVREKPLIIRLHGVLLRKPYRAVRHAVLKRWLMADGDQKAA